MQWLVLSLGDMLFLLGTSKGLDKRGHDGMENVLGKRMIDEGLVTAEQLEKALDRQKSKGGRLGESLVALGLIKEEKLATFFKNIPREPKNLEETGLDPGFISDLAMKHIYFMGSFTLKDLSEAVKLPILIMDQTVQSLRKDKMCEVKGGLRLRGHDLPVLHNRAGKKEGAGGA